MSKSTASMTLRFLALSLAALSVLTPLPAQTGARGKEAGGFSAVMLPSAGGESERLYKDSHALVIAVSQYRNGWPSLPGVRKDAELVSAALKASGFSVTLVSDPDSEGLKDAFSDFIREYGQDVENRLLFYFAGHGHTLRQSYGEEMGYIVPRDAPLPAKDQGGFLAKALDMQMIEVYAKRIQSKHALFLFDSCFSGSLFAISRAVPESIGYKTARPVRQFITSGSADEYVSDDSLFCRQFVEALEGEGDLDGDGYVTGTELGMFLQDSVINYTRASQHPQYGKIRNPNLDKGDFVFASRRGAVKGPLEAVALSSFARGAADGSAGSVGAGSTGSTGGDAAPAPATEAVTLAAAAPERLGSLRVESDPPAAAVYVDGVERGLSPFSAADLGLGDHRVELVLEGFKTHAEVFSITKYRKDVAVSVSLKKERDAYRSASGIAFVTLPAGAFDMGSSRGEPDERPVHRVSFSSPLLFGRYEITNAEFCAVMNWAVARGKASVASGDIRGQGERLYASIRSLGEKQFGLFLTGAALSPQAGRADHPVVGVTWFGAVAFCNFLSEKEGLEPVYNLSTFACDWKKAGYRLPTEAEWEYAACGAGVSRLPWGDAIDERYANFFGSKDPFDSPNPPYSQKGGPTTPAGYYDGSSRGGAATADAASPFGAYDMLGNVHEWCWDWFGAYGAKEQKDPRGPALGQKRAYRGGSWLLSETQLYSAKRFSDYSPAEASNVMGFRVVVDPRALGTRE